MQCVGKVVVRLAIGKILPRRALACTSFIALVSPGVREDSTPHSETFDGLLTATALAKVPRVRFKACHEEVTARPSFLLAPLRLTHLLRGPRLTIRLMTSKRTSAAAMVVSSAFVSNIGATSTRSAATRLTPSRPRMMVRSSRVVHPPVSGVPLQRLQCQHTAWPRDRLQ